MFAAWTGSDVNELARFSDKDTVPDVLGHDHRRPWDEFDHPLAIGLFEDHVNVTRHEVKKLVAVRM